MSMKQLQLDPDMGDSQEESWIEEEIQKELDALRPGDLQEQNDEHDTDSVGSEHLLAQAEAEPEEPMLDSMLDYMSRVKGQTDRLREELEECDVLLQEADIVSAREPAGTRKIWEDLAKEQGTDPETLRRQVLEDLDREEEEEQLYQLEHTDENANEGPPDLNEHPDTYGAFLTALDASVDVEHRAEPVVNHSEQSNTGGVEDNDCVLRKIRGVQHTDNDDGVNMGETSAVTENGVPEADGHGDSSSDASLKPEEGVVAEIYESDVLERQLRRQLWELDGRKRRQEKERRQEEEERKKDEEIKTRQNDEKRKEKQLEILEEEKQLAKDRQVKEAKLKEETDELQKRIADSLQKYQVRIDSLSEQNRRELAEFEAARQEEKARREKQQQQAATKLQASYRGYRARKIYRPQITNKVEAWKSQREQDRIASIEGKQRQELEEEEQKKKEAERIELERKEQERIAAERKKQAEEQRKKEEEERKKEQERIKIEAEEKRKEEERKRKEADEQKKEEERKRKIAEEKRKEEERKKKEAEEQRKKEERKKKEEQKRLEEEQKKKEEEQRQKEEEQRKAEEKKKEDERRQKEQENLQEEEAAKKLKAEEIKKEQQQIQEVKSPAPPVVKQESNALRASQSNGSNTARKSHQSLGRTPRSSVNVTQEEWGDYLPADLDKKRLSWIKQCKPWSKIKADLKTRKEASGSRRPLRRPISAKKLPPIADAQILSGSGVSSLQQVMTVKLCDLPGCSVKPLCQCPQLRSLTLNSCGLVAVEELEQCQQLQHLDLKFNSIEMVQLRDFVNLLHVDLSHNSLTSIHGLEGCTNIRHLDLRHNRITRIGGLASLKKLHTLKMSHNQLITTRSLGEAPTIQHLDLAHNHLPNVDDLEKLGLLQWLDVSGNNLLQVPRLTNQILMSHLVLNDNSVSTLASLLESWLPMLRTLELGQNSLSCLTDLKTCVLLETLDISNNQLLDMDSVVPGLCTLHSIQHLKLEGNPVSEESEYRDQLLKKLPTLATLDGCQRQPGQQPKRTQLELMCLAHLEDNRWLREAYEQALSTSSSKNHPTTTALHQQFYDRSHQLAEDQRLAHEYGETSRRETASDFSFSASGDRGKDAQRSQAMDMKAKFEAALGTSGDVPRKSQTVDTKAAFDQAVSAKSSVPQTMNTGLSSPAGGSALPRQPGSDVSSASFVSHPQVMSAKTSVPANLVEKIVKEEVKSSQFRLAGSNAVQQKAATKIQALWKGYQLRKRLQYALSFARCDVAEEEDDGDVMNFGEEVDLDAFDFNMDDLEKEWVPAETPQLPQSHPVLARPHNGFPPEGKTPVPPLFEKPPHPHPPSHPRRAWRGTESPISDAGNFPSGKPPLPPVSRMSDGPETQRTTDTHATGLSKKGEKISEEWGFKDSKTAELMLQRAKKLKYNAVRKKKMSQLDPKQRLALYRKLEESTKLKPVQPPPRKQTQRKDYFQAREEEEDRRGQMKVDESQEKVSRTYEWVHTQVGSYDVGTSVINHGLERAAHYNSDGNLPKIDPSVIIGGRALLTGSPQSVEVQSVESNSVHGAELPNPRRWSVTGGANSAASGEKLPPIKMSSAPNSAPSAKIGTASWRQPVVNQSVGWGGGKKRAGRR